MNKIKAILEKTEPTIQELISCFEVIKENGNVAVIKFDGERTHNWYTVFLTFPNNQHQIIREDKDNLRDALIAVLSAYLEC